MAYHWCSVQHSELRKMCDKIVKHALHVLYLSRWLRLYQLWSGSFSRSWMFALVRDVKTLYTKKTHRHISFRKPVEINKCVAVSPIKTASFDLILECLSTVNLYPKSLFWQKKKFQRGTLFYFCYQKYKNKLFAVSFDCPLSCLFCQNRSW